MFHKFYRITVPVVVTLLVAFLLLLFQSFPFAFFHLIAFPFGEISSALMQLSGTGSAGNGAALFLVAALVFLPMVLVCIFDRLRRDKVAVGGSMLLSAVFAIGYLLLLQKNRFIPEGLNTLSTYLETYSAMVGAMMWSAILALASVLIIRVMKNQSTESLLRCGAVLFYALGGVFGGVSLSSLISSLFALGKNDGATLRHIVDFIITGWKAVPGALCMISVCSAAEILLAHEMGRPDLAAGAASKATHLAYLSIIISLGASVLANLLPLLLHRIVQNTEIHVTIPLAEFACLVILSLGSKLMDRNVALKQENDMII